MLFSLFETSRATPESKTLSPEEKEALIGRALSKRTIPKEIQRQIRVTHIKIILSEKNHTRKSPNAIQRKIEYDIGVIDAKSTPQTNPHKAHRRLL